MAALGIPTTRALSVVGADLPVRGEEIESAAVVARVAPSFVRFGSFEHWAAHGRGDELRLLADYVIDTFRPECRAAANPYAALLADVSRRTGELIAHWMAVGFMHGVMNTDNMSILGLTLDYGPFGFMEAFDAGHICNHSDHQGRYTYRNQPHVAQWNLYRLAEAFRPLTGDQALVRAVVDDNYGDAFEAHFEQLMCAKLGLREALPDDENFIAETFALLQQHRPDFTQFFRALSQLPAAVDPKNRPKPTLRCATCLSTAPPATPGWPLARPSGADAVGRRRAAGGDARRQPEIRAAQLAGRSRDPQGAGQGFFRGRTPARLPAPSVRRAAGVRTLCRPAARLGERAGSQLFQLVRNEAALVVNFELAQAIAVERAELFGGQNGVDRAQFAMAVAVDQQRLIAEAMRQRRVVQDHDDARAAVARRAGEQFEHGHLVVEVEVGERLVEQVERRRLGEQGGDGQPLALAAGQGVDLPLFHAGETDGGQRAARQFGVTGGLPVPAAEVRVATGERGFEYRRAERIGLRLAEPGAAQGRVARAQCGVGGAAEFDAAGNRFAQPGQRGEQGRFAGAVAAEDGQPLT